MNLSDKAKISVLWVGIGRTVSRLLAVASMVVLCRLLSPSDFGVVAMSRAAWAFIGELNKVGIGASIIYQQRNIENFAIAAFWMNLLVAVGIVFLAWVASPFMASFFDNTLIQPIILLLSIGFFINAFGSVHSTLLRKELEFGRLTALEILLEIVTRATAIVMAFWGYGVWSLVLPNVLSAPIKVVILWWLCPWRPSFRLELACWREIFDYGKHVFGSNLLRLWNFQGPVLVIGKLLGTTSLGLYSFAYTIASWPAENIGMMVGNVAFPFFSKIQGDSLRTQSSYLKILLLLSIVGFFSIACIFVLADEAIPLIFGDKWIGSILLLKIILLMTIVRVLAQGSIQIMLAQGRPDLEFKVRVIILPILMGGVIVGAKYGGIMGATLAVALADGLGYLALIKGATSLVDLKPKEVFNQVSPALACSLLAGFFVFFIQRVLLDMHYSLIVVLASSASLATLIYLISLFTIFRERFNELLFLIPGAGTRVARFLGAEVTSTTTG